MLTQDDKERLLKEWRPHGPPRPAPMFRTVRISPWWRFWKVDYERISKFTFQHGHTFGEHKMHESTYREGIVRSLGDDFPRIITESSGTEEFVAHFPVGGDMKQSYDALLES